MLEAKNSIALFTPNVDYRSQEEKEADQLLDSMPVEVQTFFSQDTPVEPLDHVPVHKPAWCMCEMPEGEFPRVTIYNNLSALVGAVASREGNDTAVWITYGTAFNLTRAIVKANGSKCRFLLLPEENKAVRIDQELPPLIIDSSLLPNGAVVQEEGWLGESNTLQPYYQEGVSKEEDEEK